MPISLGFRSNPARNSQAGRAELINCFAEELGTDSKATVAIYGVEGFIDFGTELEGGPQRAWIVVGNTLYVVAGRNVYAVTTAGVATLVGAIATDGPVYLARNRKVPPQIGIVSDGLYYVLDTTANSVTLIADPDLPPPISISSLDGYGVIPVVNGSYFLTGLDEMGTIDGLDEGTAESYPDEIVRSMVLEQELVLFGETSIEWHQDTGDPDFPFTRVHATQLGYLAAQSCALVDTPERKTIIWVAPDHTVRLMNGYSGQVISNTEIQTLIKNLHLAGNINQLKGFGWAYEGRFTYVLTCNSWSRQYDSKTNNWVTRKSYGLNRWRVNDVIRFGEKLIGADFETGQLYQMDGAYKDEAGKHLISKIITPPVHAFPYPIKINALYLDAATGVGLNAGDEFKDNPKLLISMSRDAGQSWSVARERELSRMAQMRRIQPIYRLGRASDKGVLFKFEISAPVERVFLQAAVSFDKMTA